MASCDELALSIFDKVVGSMQFGASATEEESEIKKAFLWELSERVKERWREHKAPPPVRPKSFQELIERQKERVAGELAADEKEANIINIVFDGKLPFLEGKLYSAFVKFTEGAHEIHQSISWSYLRDTAVKKVIALRRQLDEAAEIGDIETFSSSAHKLGEAVKEFILALRAPAEKTVSSYIEKAKSELVRSIVGKLGGRNEGLVEFLLNAPAKSILDWWERTGIGETVRKLTQAIETLADIKEALAKFSSAEHEGLLAELPAGIDIPKLSAQIEMKIAELKSRRAPLLSLNNMFHELYNKRLSLDIAISRIYSAETQAWVLHQRLAQFSELCEKFVRALPEEITRTEN